MNNLLCLLDSAQNMNTPCLRTSRQSSDTSRRLMQRHLGSPSPHQTGQDLTSTLVPLRQLLCRDSIWVPTGVETGNEARGLGISAADVEGPADQGTVLVGVEDDRRRSLQGDAVLETLETGSQW